MACWQEACQQGKTKAKKKKKKKRKEKKEQQERSSKHSKHSAPPSTPNPQPIFRPEQELISTTIDRQLAFQSPRSVSGPLGGNVCARAGERWLLSNTTHAK